MTTLNKQLEKLRPTYNMMIAQGKEGLDEFCSYLYDYNGITVDMDDDEILIEYFNL